MFKAVKKGLLQRREDVIQYCAKEQVYCTTLSHKKNLRACHGCRGDAMNYLHNNIFLLYDVRVPVNHYICSNRDRL